jgi:hypothetical protein
MANNGIYLKITLLHSKLAVATGFHKENCDEEFRIKLRKIIYKLEQEIIMANLSGVHNPDAVQKFNEIKKFIA